jgi:hypothetical protein
MYNIPILILTYNRPKKFSKVVKSLGLIKPRKIYISCDGPKNHEDVIKIKNIRKNISKINWKCKIYENFFEKNLGIEKGVQKGIDWFFYNEKMGIILEDDVIPSKLFFKYSKELLIKFRNNKDISAISGFNYFGKTQFGDGDYFLSKYFLCWGWASWRRAWMNSNKNFDYWPKWKRLNFLKKIHQDPIEIRYWTKLIEKYYNKSIVSWDNIFGVSMWKTESFCLLPNINMIKNIGFDHDATYGFNKKYKTPNIVHHVKNIKHPSTLRVNLLADKVILNKFYKAKNLLYPWRFFYITKLIFFNPDYVVNKLIRKLR